MPPDITAAQKMSLDSDYPVDKILFGGTANFPISGSTQGYVFFAHGMPFAPLMFGTWSNNASYSILYGLNSGAVASNPTVSLFDATMRIHADSTYVYLYGDNYTVSSMTFYARMYGFAPTTFLGSLSLFSSLPNPFIFNTDDNYTKLYTGDAYPIPAGGGTPIIYRLPHSLGADTQIQSWKEDATGLVIPLTFMDGGLFQTEDVTVSVDSVNVIIETSGFNPALTIHYRLYLDN